MEFDTARRGLAAALGEMRGLTKGFSADLTETTRAMRAMDAEAGRLARSIGSSLRSAFDSALFRGEALGDVLRDLASDLAGRTLDAALRPVQAAVGRGVSNLVGGLTGALGGALGFARGGVLERGRERPLPFSDGATFDAGRVRAFARGGIVDGPTLFPMRGATGLMGEAGPEAILPLSRGPDGRLGVNAERTGGGAVVNVQITTPDAESFRRSRGQVAAELARAVARGNRRL